MGAQDFLEGKNERMNQQLLFTAEIDKRSNKVKQGFQKGTFFCDDEKKCVK